MLTTYLDSTAADAIAILTLTAANYAEAIATLKKRFGNIQLVVNRHTEGLLSSLVVGSQHEVRGLCHLYNVVDSYVRGLGCESYGRR